MTQPVLFATPDSDMAPVTEDAAVAIARKKDSARTSAIVQRCFEIAALDRGYEIAIAIECGKDFDVIVRLPGGRPVVIQIKTGIWLHKNSHYFIRNCSQGRVYSATAYDILAVFLPDRKQWLFYTRAELGNRTTTSYTPQELRQRARRGFHGIYGQAIADRDPDNWNLLDEVAAAKINSGSGTANVPPHVR